MSTETQPKKVRLACQRCRLRRVKCDGSIPACGNCSRAGVQCIDVDGRNADQLIPRGFLVNGPARIRWLEEVIRTHLPDFDLNQGPQIDVLPSDININAVPAPNATSAAPTAAAAAAAAAAEDEEEALAPSAESPTHARAPSFAATAPSIGTVLETSQSHQSSSPLGVTSNPKRPASHISQELERASQDEVRNVATGLGMLSLNSDSRQKHYMGTSSGLLFTRVIGLGEAESEASPSTQSAVENVQPAASLRGSRKTIMNPRGVKQSLQALYRRLQTDLPSKEDAYGLFEVYFSEIHIDHPFMHAPSLLMAMEAIYDCVDLNPNAATTGPQGWPEFIKPFAYNGEMEVSNETEVMSISIYTAAFHVFMVLHLAASVRTRPNEFDISPTKLYKAALTCATETFCTISLPSLQGLLLLTIRALVLPAELNLWTLSHLCMAHCIDIGIHRGIQGSEQVSAHVRCLVFYTAYSLERSIATIQGRPLGIRDEAFDIALPEDTPPLDTSVDGGRILRDIPEASIIEHVAAQSLPYAVHAFNYYKIVSDIKGVLYLLPPRSSDSLLWPKDPTGRQEDLRKELDDWIAQIPLVISRMCDSGVSEDEADRFRLKLELRYHQGMVLLHQPSQAIRHPSPRSIAICQKHSAEIIRGYNSLYNRDNLYFSWRTVQSIFYSGTIMVSCFWAADALTRASDVFSEMAKDLRTCSSLLSASGEWWPSAKRGKDAFERMIDQTLRSQSQAQRAAMEARVLKGPRLGYFEQRIMSPNPNTGQTIPCAGLNFERMDLGIDNNDGAAQEVLTLERGVTAANMRQGEIASYHDLHGMDNFVVPPDIEVLMAPYQHDAPGWDLFGMPAAAWGDENMSS